MSDSPPALFLTPEKQWPEQTFNEYCAGLRERIGARVEVAVYSPDPILLNALCAIGREAGLKLQVLHSSFDPQSATEIARRNQAELLIRGDAATPEFESLEAKGFNDAGGKGWLGIYTSGTSGRAKLSLHDWEVIQRPAGYVKGDLANRRWLMCYSPTSYAGMQVLFAAWNSGGSVVYQPGSMTAICRAIVECGVEVISATPTFWRMLMSAWPPDLEHPPLCQATLGGEAVRQDVLDLIQTFFRPQQLTHIYASSETGPAIVVSDGREGFPAAWLERENSRAELRIRNGVLQVRSIYGMLGYAQGTDAKGEGGWFSTPDRLEVVGDRVFFRGRTDAVVNVGGVKIPVEEIEWKIQKLTGVVDVAVYSKANAITGSLLAADIVLEPGADRDIARVKAMMRGVLDSHFIPQFVRIVETIRVGEGGKKSRS